jgi:Protein of unknown function (DUF2934)
MQSSKPSKKTRKSAEETVAATPESGISAPELKSKSRASKSSTTKKATSETGGAKHRKARTAEPFASPAIDSPVIDPVGVMTPSPEAQEVTHANIAKLAYSYWIARDYAHGFAEEDWHRAERELKEKR